MPKNKNYPQFCLFEDFSRLDLLPLTYTRPLSFIRVGIDTIYDKWKRFLKMEPQLNCMEYLKAKYNPEPIEGEYIFINSKFFPCKTIGDEIFSKLKPDECILYDDIEVLAFRKKVNQSNPLLHKILTTTEIINTVKKVNYLNPENRDHISAIRKCTDIFQKNGEMLREDYKELTHKRKSKSVNDKHTILYQTQDIFIEEGLTIHAAIINAEKGPVYIGKNVTIEENAVIQGPVAIGEGSHINIGAKIRPETTIGPFSKVGGEVSNSVIFGYSNKSHDGFMGNSVIAEWCNLGADTNTSNLKNNYSTIKSYSFRTKKMLDTGLQFCGLVMGDHSKCGINSMFNTGTVCGIGANIFGGDFLPKAIPSFAWGGAKTTEIFQLEKFFTMVELTLKRRKIKFSELDKQILKNIYENTISI